MHPKISKTCSEIVRKTGLKARFIKDFFMYIIINKSIYLKIVLNIQFLDTSFFVYLLICLTIINVVLGCSKFDSISSVIRTCLFVVPINERIT